MSLNLAMNIPQELILLDNEMVLVGNVGLYKRIKLEENTVLVIEFENCVLRIDVSLDEIKALVDENSKMVFEK